MNNFSKSQIEKDDLIARIVNFSIAIMIIGVTFLIWFNTPGQNATKVITAIFIVLPVTSYGVWLLYCSFRDEYLELPLLKREHSIISDNLVGFFVAFIGNILIIVFAIPLALLLRKLGFSGKTNIT